MSKKHDGARDESPGTIKIIGIGQSLRGDDGAGLAAVHLWQARYQETTERPDLQVELAELPGIGLLSLMENARVVILVDAVYSGASAGTIHLLARDQLEAFQKDSGSAHGWGVAETLKLGEKLMPSSMPDKLFIIGIEAADFSLGETLSPEVEMALPEATRLIEKLATGEIPGHQESSPSSRISPR